MKHTARSKTVDVHHRIQLVAAILSRRTPIKPWPFQLDVLLIALTFFALAPMVRAVNPPPDGGYPNFTTAEGDNALKALTTGVGNTAIGTFSLFSVTTGNFNTAVGAGSLDLNQGDSNTATGAAALLFNTAGTQNTAVGTAALEFNDTGSQNTANGAFALFLNTEGEFNTAIGVEALKNNTTGSDNTASGYRALVNNTTGGRNTADGVETLFSNEIGTDNTATGFQTLVSNTTGSQDTANGSAALISNTTGGQNTAFGAAALAGNTIGEHNTAAGFGALATNTAGIDNTAAGSGALVSNTTGIRNTAIGYRAGEGLATGDNNVYIGAFVSSINASESNTTRISNIYGSVVTEAAVYVNSEGKLGTLASSRRFKDEIKPMDTISEALFSLKPVTFRYKKEIDSRRVPQFGLVAEEVEKASPDLVVRDKAGGVYSVRYEAVNAMLLNEFLKEHKKVEKQQATIRRLNSNAAKQEVTINELKKDMGVLIGQLKEQAAEIQKVIVQVGQSGSLTRVVVSNP